MRVELPLLYAMGLELLETCGFVESRTYHPPWEKMAPLDFAAQGCFEFRLADVGCVPDFSVGLLGRDIRDRLDRDHHGHSSEQSFQDEIYRLSAQETSGFSDLFIEFDSNGSRFSSEPRYIVGIRRDSNAVFAALRDAAVILGRRFQQNTRDTCERLVASLPPRGRISHLYLPERGSIVRLIVDPHGAASISPLLVALNWPGDMRLLESVLELVESAFESPPRLRVQLDLNRDLQKGISIEVFASAPELLCALEVLVRCSLVDRRWQWSIAEWLSLNRAAVGIMFVSETNAFFKFVLDDDVRCKGYLVFTPRVAS